jgi:hypothetical protein
MGKTIVFMDSDRPGKCQERYQKRALYKAFLLTNLYLALKNARLLWFLQIVYSQWFAKWRLVWLIRNDAFSPHKEPF